MSKLKKPRLYPVMLAFVVLCIQTELPAQETIISKKDADFVFGLSKPEWEKSAVKFFAPGWVVRSFTKFEMGSMVIAFNPATGNGMSIKPLYENDHDKPLNVIVGNYFPVGAFPPMTDDLKQSMESEAQKDLGPTYYVRLNYFKTENLEVIELLLTRNSIPKTK